jgi:multidrug efflux system membrane fusion protein
VVAEGQPVLRLADPAERELLVQVPEAAVPAALSASAPAVAFWARPGEPVAAQLRELAPQADPVLRTYAARFSLPDAPDWARLGMTGTVRLAAGAGGEAALSVPASALHDRDAGPMLWRVVAGRAETVPVRVLRLDATTATVTASGLAPGDPVVSLGVQRLVPGEALRVVQARLAAAGR